MWRMQLVNFELGCLLIVLVSSRFVPAHGTWMLLRCLIRAHMRSTFGGGLLSYYSLAAMAVQDSYQ